MPEAQEIVINTGPLIALVAATGDLRMLQMYDRVWVPWEVNQEMATGGMARFALVEFEAASWLHKHTQPARIAPHLLNCPGRSWRNMTFQYPGFLDYA